MDIKAEIFNEILEVGIYMDQPEGFIEEGNEHLVCSLKKALYGLKQSLRACVYSSLTKAFVGAKHIICCTSKKWVSIFWLQSFMWIN